MQFVCDLRQRVLEERQQRAHIDVVRSGDFGGGDHVIRQIAHGRGAARRKLRVGDEIDGHEIGERLRQRSLFVHVRDGLLDFRANRIDCGNGLFAVVAFGVVE